MDNIAKEIVPFDFHSKVKFDVWDIMNEFKHKGFYSRSSFINIVCEILPKKNTEDGRKRLQNFWNSLVNDPKLNKELRGVLEKLSTE